MDQFIRNLEARFGLIVTALIGLLVSVVLGVTIGQENLFPIAGLAGAGAVMFTVLRMRESVWLLIPIGWYLSGSLGFLPLPFSVRDLCVLLPTAMFIVFVAMGRRSLEAPVTALDLVLFLNLGYVATVYVRHPVGTSAFGSGIVGGRPYFNILIAFLAYSVLVRTFAEPRIAKRIPFLMAMPQILVSLLGCVVFLVPTLAPAVRLVYDGLDAAGAEDEMDPDAGDNDLPRIFDLQSGARVGGVALLSYFSPGSLMNPGRPVRMLGFLACFVAMGLSGFRNGIFYLSFVTALAALIRERVTKMIQIVLVLIVLVGTLAGLQSVGVHLPATIQRSLSFLPGNWDQIATSEAEGSSEWRFYMWRLALTTNEFIKDKIFGDGFGFSASELAIMQDKTGYIGYERQESFMVVGAFHSGPVSTIRFVGVVGLVLYVSLLIFSAVRAWRLIRMTRGSPYFPLAMFVALPVIYEPIQYLFIFGAYDSGSPNAIFLCGVIRLVENSWAHWWITQGRPVSQAAPSTLASI